MFVINMFSISYYGINIFTTNPIYWLQSFQKIVTLFETFFID